MNTNKELIELFKSSIARLESDIAKHEEYISSATSLEYHHYVVMIRPSDDSFIKDWTVSLTTYGPELQKRTTADNYYVFTSRKEAAAAARKIKLINPDGTFVKTTTSIIACRDWHKHMIAWEKDTIETFNELIAQTVEQAAA